MPKRMEEMRSDCEACDSHMEALREHIGIVSQEPIEPRSEQGASPATWSHASASRRAEKTGRSSARF